LHGEAGHATNPPVTTGTGASIEGARPDSFAGDWQALRADHDIQFAPVEIPPPQPPPEWMKDLSEFLSTFFKPVGEFVGALAQLLGMSAPVLLWILGALVVVFLAVLVWRIVAPLARRRREAEQAEPDWTPDTSEALALLEDADRLAAEGHYDEATHLLLRRSVGQIAAARPDLLEPSTTAREISVLPALPDAARNAFAVIAGRVERSLFALRSLSADDWRAARAAYADFALAAPQGAPA
jgi:hypothetical protein